MNPRIRTRPTKRGDARRYLTKATEFVESAKAEFVAGRWTAAGLAAVHAGISAADAVTASRAGCVSSSDDHIAVIGLLRECVPGIPATTERQLVGLISAKNTIEYDDGLQGHEPLRECHGVLASVLPLASSDARPAVAWSTWACPT